MTCTSVWMTESRKKLTITTIDHFSSTYMSLSWFNLFCILVNLEIVNQTMTGKSRLLNQQRFKCKRKYWLKKICANSLHFSLLTALRTHGNDQGRIKSVCWSRKRNHIQINVSSLYFHSWVVFVYHVHYSASTLN